MALRFADHEFAALSELRWHPEAKRSPSRRGRRHRRGLDAGADRVGAPADRAVPRRSGRRHRRLVGRRRTGHGRGTTPCTSATVHRCSIRAPGFTFHSVDGRSFDIVTDTSTLPARRSRPPTQTSTATSSLTSTPSMSGARKTKCSSATPRDPFKTIDTRRSSRRVEVEIAGTTIADSTRSVMLFETYLPTRYYLPREDVRMDLLVPVRHYLGLCVQGPRPVLVGARRQHRGHGRGVELRGPAQLRDVGEGHDLLLQRAGRHQRRRRADGSSTHPVVRLTPSPRPSTSTRARQVSRAYAVRCSPVLRFRRRSCRGRRAWTAGRSARRLAAFRTGA